MIAIIPARGGSKSIPKKNLADLCGHPLIAYPIVRAKECNKITGVFVSTDDKKIADVAHQYGATVIYRPKELSTDSCSDVGWLRHAATLMDIHRSDESIIHLRATTPMIKPSGLGLAINKWKSVKDKYTSLVSVHTTPESVFKYYTISNGILHPINSDYVNQAKQNVPKTYKPNGYIEIVKVNWFMNNDTARGNTIFPFETPITEEVDGPEELDYIRYLMGKPENECYKIN
jgi:CMP-N,N'-diacetyllegionaminic acid synthase